jgi:hypothetical protein
MRLLDNRADAHSSSLDGFAASIGSKISKLNQSQVVLRLAGRLELLNVSQDVFETAGLRHQGWQQIAKQPPGPVFSFRNSVCGQRQPLSGPQPIARRRVSRGFDQADDEVIPLKSSNSIVHDGQGQDVSAIGKFHKAVWICLEYHHGRVLANAARAEKLIHQRGNRRQ